MKNSRLYPSFLLAAAMAVLLLAAARAEEPETTSIKLSDPSKPCILKVTIANGDLTIRGFDVTDVSVSTDVKPEAPEQRKDGLRVLTSSSSYSLTEKNNVVSLTHGIDSWGGGGPGGDFTLSVPRNTAVVVKSSFGGDIDIGSVTGNIEVNCLNGEVVLRDLTGAATVETMNGEITANVRELAENKALSFTSMNGEVKVNLPRDAKANVRLRTRNGSILTDFDEKSLVTKTETVRITPNQVRVPRSIAINQKSTTAEISESAHASAEAAREAAQGAKASAVATQNAARASRAASESNDTFAARIPPMAPLPPMTGGKMVTGTLHGGGTEIRITTMNGDVILRKIADAK